MVKPQFTIFVADDDPDDCLLIKDALSESKFSHEVKFSKDGEELMKRLRSGDTLPDLILLDLNMPRKDGREALREIKCDSRLKSIPIVILTTSSLEEDISEIYSLGGNSFITKPALFKSLVDVMRMLRVYWFDIVELPKPLPMGQFHKPEGFAKELRATRREP